MSTVRIGTFNIQHGRDHGKYLETKTETIDLPKMASVIREASLDVCALNEVRDEEFTPVACNQAKEIAAELGYHFRFAKAIDFRGGGYGNAIVSRYPIRAVRTYRVAVPKSERIGGGHYYEDRVLLSADLDVDGQTLTVLACHFGLAPDEQTRAVETAKRALSETPHPAVLLGDFNVRPDSEIYRALAKTFTDAADGSLPNFTFPSHAPDRKIDYLFTANGARAKGFTVCPRIASDHLAVWSEVEF